MNAAARLLNQGSLSRSWVISVLLARFQYSLVTIYVLLLLTSLSLVYVTNHTRSLNASIQKAYAEKNRLHVQRGQLLLEQSTLLRQPRIEKIAKKQLLMKFPEGKAVVVIQKSLL